jgi:hypothetical protein
MREGRGSMKLSRFLRSLFCTLVVWLGLHAQEPELAPMPRVHDQIYYMNADEWLLAPFSPSGDFFLASYGRRLPITRPAGTGSGIVFRKDAIWQVAPHKIAGKESLALFQRPIHLPQAGWDVVGDIETPFGFPSILIPLDQPNMFLGVSEFLGFANKDHASNLALYRKQEDHLRFDAFVDMPFGDQNNIGRPHPIKTETTSDGVQRTYYECLIQPAALTPNIWLPVILADYLVLASSKTGYLWIYGLESGSFKRAVDLGHVQANELSRTTKLNHFLLSTISTPDQKIRAVTRDPFLLNLAILCFTDKNTSVNDRKALNQKYLDGLKDADILRWYEIDPITGAVRELDEPGLPTHEHISRQNSMRFLVGPNGKTISNQGEKWTDALNKAFVDYVKSKKPPLEPTVKAKSEQ